MTERLILRAVRLDDAADVLVFRGDAYVQRFNSEPLKTIEEATLFIQDAQKQAATGAGFGWGITLRGEDRVLGGVSLHAWEQHHRRAEVGWALAAKRCGRCCTLALPS